MTYIYRFSQTPLSYFNILNYSRLHIFFSETGVSFFFEKKWLDIFALQLSQILTK